MSESKSKRIYNFVGEVRSKDDSEKFIEGHAAVFEQYANIGNRFYEIIDRGAFDGCDLKDVALLVNHNDSAPPLARTTSGTLKLTVDSFGLAIRARLDVENNPDAKTLYSAVERGDLSGMSFCFQIAEGGDEWQNLDSDMPIRRIKHFKKIYEVSVCTYPAYTQTDIQARADKLLTSARQKFSNHKEKRHISEATMKNVELQTAGNILRQMKTGEELKISCIFDEQRATTISSPSIITPSYSSKNVNSISPTSLIDVVKHVKIVGGDEFVQPYIVEIPVGNYTDESVAAIMAEPTFGYSAIGRIKVTAYAELSREMKKLPAADYAATVFECVRTSIQRVLSNEILYGEGATPQQCRITGIFSSQASAIDSSTDISVATITDVTLDDILSAYSGEFVAVETPAVLILSPQDLMAFSRVRTSIRSKIYNIIFDSGCSGTINGIRFIIDSACKSIISSDTRSGEYCMAYGNPQNYQLVEFSPMTVEKSDDYKFREGMIAYLASGYYGGNVCRRNGFVRVKKS